jgi:hypothetical protein
VGSLFFVSSRTGHGSSKVFELLPDFSCISWSRAFSAGDDASICLVGPSRQREALVWLPRRAGSSGISWRIHSLVKKTLYRHRAGFEPQRALPFMKRVKASKILGEAARVRTATPLFVLPFTLLVVLGSSTSGDQHFFEIVVLCRPPPRQDWGRVRTAGSRFARDDKEQGSSWGKQLPGKMAS